MYPCGTPAHPHPNTESFTFNSTIIKSSKPEHTGSSSYSPLPTGGPRLSSYCLFENVKSYTHAGRVSQLVETIVGGALAFQYRVFISSTITNIPITRKVVNRILIGLKFF